MDYANAKEGVMMKCNMTGCPGEYEVRLIVHTVKYQGEIIVINDVPAEVCPVCGDVLFKPETVRQIEKSLQTKMRPEKVVPLYEFM
ncbi:MAG: YgiT-type zinc finger protein [Chloroflexi bacterium]|nr:YgiT-type zinc finger protein [Chloroflexota bacterium]